MSLFSLCTVTDFSAGALPIGVKFCMAVRPHLRQVLSYLGGGVATGMAELWASTGAIWWDMLLAEALVHFVSTPPSSKPRHFWLLLITRLIVRNVTSLKVESKQYKRLWPCFMCYILFWKETAFSLWRAELWTCFGMGMLFPCCLLWQLRCACQSLGLILWPCRAMYQLSQWRIGRRCERSLTWRTCHSCSVLPCGLPNLA